MPDLISPAFGQAPAIEVQAPHGSRVRHRRLPFSIPVVLAATVVLGLATSVACALALARAADRLAEARFQQTAAHILQALQTRIADTNGTLLTLGDLISAAPATERAEFQDFAKRSRSRSTALRDTGWAPRIEGDQRHAFEANVAASGFPGFQVREPDAAHALGRAPDHPIYYPILFPDPVEITPKVIGINLIFEPIRAAAIAKSIATRRPAATPPMRLMTVGRDFSGFMSFLPVFAPDASDTTPPIGVVYGVFEIEPMLKAAIASEVQDPATSLLFFERSGNQRTIFWHPASLDGSRAEEPSLAAARAGPHFEGDIDLADQRWGVLLIPPSRPQIGLRDRTAFTMLAAGILFTVAVAAFIALIGRRNARLESLTMDLEKAARAMEVQRAQLSHMAWHDALTGLPNRAWFDKELRTRLGGRGAPFALILVDLDGFKPINDRHGHLVGDTLLVQAAARLHGAVAKTGSAARLGGDEFALVWEGAPEAVAAFCHAVLGAFEAPFTIDGCTIRIGLSMGVVFVDDRAIRTKALVKRADDALYDAKAAGRGTFRIAGGPASSGMRDRPAHAAA